MSAVTDKVRVRVRINGAAGGIHFSFEPGVVTDDDFVNGATEKLGVPAVEDVSKVKLCVDGDEAKVGDLEKGDVVYLAITGSPLREAKLARPESAAPPLALPPHVGASETPTSETPTSETPTRADVQRATMTPATIVPFASALVLAAAPSPMLFAANSPMPLAAVATGSFVQKVLSLGLCGGRQVNTIGCEVAAAFSWTPCLMS
jgi:hypothetical protein